jgi:hypothetical protein
VLRYRTCVKVPWPVTAIVIAAISLLNRKENQERKGAAQAASPIGDFIPCDRNPCTRSSVFAAVRSKVTPEYLCAHPVGSYWRSTGRQFASRIVKCRGNPIPSRGLNHEDKIGRRGQLAIVQFPCSRKLRANVVSEALVRADGKQYSFFVRN